MSTLDITRHLDQPTKHYAGARLQQGRLLTDADFNEAARAVAEDQRRSVADFVGGNLFSSSASPDHGFSIGKPITLGTTTPEQSEPLRFTDALERVAFVLNGESTWVRPVSIRAGTFYLGGMRFELERPEPFMFQRDFLQMTSADTPLRDRGAEDAPFWSFYYLEAWEQAVTPVEDHEFLEKALGGRDTSVRIRRMRQVKAFSVESSGSMDCGEVWQKHFLPALQAQRFGVIDGRTGELVPLSRLRVTFKPGVSTTDCEACTPAQGARFLGAANQTLRVMLSKSDRFVWSFDNAAPLYRVEVTGLEEEGADIVVRLLTPLKDDEHAPLVNRVIELIPFAALEDGTKIGTALDPFVNKVAAEIGAFSRVVRSYDPNSRTFVLDRNAPGIAEVKQFVTEWDDDHPDFQQLFSFPDGEPAPHKRYFFMRLWHEAPTVDEIELQALKNPTQSLGGTGYFAAFVAAQPGARGDSWTIALRPESPEKTVPFDFARAEGMPPNGPRHFFAPLASLRGANEVVSENSDCRPILRPLTDVDCVTFTVGDGRLTKGEFTSIQEAIDTLPEEGGTVLVRPGKYVEKIMIAGRRNITLLGCGDATFIDTPGEVEGNADGVIAIVGHSEKIRVSGFRVRSAHDSAFFLDDVTDVAVTDITFDDRTPQTFRVRAQLVKEFVLAGLTVGFVNQPLLSLDDCHGFLIDNVSAGGQDFGDLIDYPTILIERSTGGVVSDVRISTLGMFGVAVRGEGNSEIEIKRVVFESGAANSKAGRLFEQAKSGVDVEGERIQVRECRVLLKTAEFVPSTYAGITVQGTDIEVSDNHVEAEFRFPSFGPSAFGGIHVRGNSSRVTVRENRIVRGIGHGVTLGSVRWQPSGDAPSRREGPGENQMYGDGPTFLNGAIRQFNIDGVSYTAVDEGVLTDISIIANQIEEFSSNGISSLTVFGLGPLDNADFIQISRLRVVGNRIHDNIRYPQLSSERVAPEIHHANPRSPWRSRIPLLPYGGIVFGHVDQADIRENTITDNGTSPQAPICGIFVALGETLSICRNVVTNNGGQATPDVKPHRGVKGGITIMLAGFGTPGNDAELNTPIFTAGGNLTSDGLSARISDNIVRHPEGRALHLLAAGPVQVDGNFFSSEGYHGSDDSEERFAIGDAVFIQNLGGPWERFNILQTDFDQPTNPSGPDVSGRGDFNDYDTPRDALVYLMNKVPQSPRHFMGIGGQVLFQNNQVIYDWQVRRSPYFDEPLTTFAVSIMTLDHASVGMNQFAARVQPLPNTTPPAGDPELGSNELFYANVFVAGATVEATANRIAEVVDTARFSMLLLGELAYTSVYNQGTHQIFQTGANFQGAPSGVSFSAHTGNQEMLVKRDEQITNRNWVFNLGSRLFMSLMERTIYFGDAPPDPPGG